IDLSLLAAIEVWKGGHPGADGLRNSAVLDQTWGVQRVKNLMCAWRDQLLEILGAMGMREVRRLRGEVGRGLFHEELLREFKSVFGTPLEMPRKPVLPKNLIPKVEAPIKNVQRNFHNELAKFKVNVTSDCIHCGLCVATCPYGVFSMPPGLNKLMPPQ